MNEEEIETMKEDLSNLHNMLGKKPSISKKAIKNALKYIEELEQRETILDKVTDKLIKDKKELMEELKYNITKREAQMQLILVDKYLKNILEGEKK
mgnify:CR=1 FL=1